jgi:hypothetical protein
MKTMLLAVAAAGLMCMPSVASTASTPDPVQYFDVCTHTFTGTFGPIDDPAKARTAKVQSCGDEVTLTVGEKAIKLNDYMTQSGVWSFQSNLDYIIKYVGRPPAGFEVKPDTVSVSENITFDHTDLGLRLPDSAAAVILFVDQDGREVYWMPSSAQ